ncbi:MAG: tetratricopeptide repeat protein [Myxococcales bacterium]|nr:tetratricopeptide repeat protein [Myxococcales bacterium]
MRIPSTLGSLLTAGAFLLTACTEPGQTEIARGNVLASRGEHEQAIEAFRAAVAAAPGKARPQELLGHALFDRKRLVEARAAYEGAARSEPRAAIEARIGLARIDAEEGKLDQAIARLDEVLAGEPSNLYALLSRGNLAMRRGGPGDAERAITDTAEAMRIAPKNPSALYTRGCAFLAAQDPKAAGEAFELLKKAHPTSPLGPYGLARVAAASGRETDVVLHLRETKAKAKGLPGAWDPEEIRKDPAFQFVKDKKDFQEVFAE